MTAVAYFSESRTVMMIAVDLVFMNVIRVLWAEQHWANGARKVVHVIFLVCAGTCAGKTTGPEGVEGSSTPGRDKENINHVRGDTRQKEAKSTHHMR